MTIGAVLLAAATVLLLAELGLRVTEWLLLDRRGNTPAGGARKMLCVGDSWTYGVESGDPARLSYPAQLQRLIARRSGGTAWQVINRGRPGLNSRLLRSRLPAQLDRYRPSVVVLLVGAANFYDAGQAHSADPSLAGLGAWRRLKVLRLWRLLSAPQQDPPRSPAQAREAERVRRELVAKVSRPLGTGGYHDDLQGMPKTTAVGCGSAGRLRRLSEAVLGAAGGGTAALSPVLRRAPGCRRLLVLAAEQCLAKRDLGCAERYARRVLAQDFFDPRATAVLSAIQLSRAGKLTSEDWHRLKYVTIFFPRFMRARRLWSLVLLQTGEALCVLKQELIRASQRCPRCGWTRAAIKVLMDQVQTPGTRTLRQDLRAIGALCRRRGVRLLLLNYPPSERDICGDLARRVIASVARGDQLPLLDIGTVLGPLPDASRSPYYGAQDHPNHHGYRRLAGAVQARLLALGWL